MTLKHYIIAFLLVLCSASPGHAEEFSAYAAPLSPYATTKGLHLHGITVDLFAELMEDVGSPIDTDDIKLVSLSNALAMGQQKPATIILNVERKQHLAPLYKWVGPVITRHFGIIASEDGKRLYEMGDLMSHRTATVRGSESKTRLLDFGIPKSNLVSCCSYVMQFRELMNHKVDFLAYDVATASYYADKMHTSLDNFKVVKEFGEMKLYYAFSRDIGDSLIAKLNQSLKKMKKKKANGKSHLDEIIEQYLPNGFIQSD